MLAPSSKPDDPVQTWNFCIGLEEVPENPDMVLAGRCNVGTSQGTWQATVEDGELYGTIQIINFTPGIIPEQKIKEMIDVIIEEMIYGP